jgi:hypothetical protein
MVRYLTTNGKSNSYELYNPFALRYRRVNGTFYECINVGDRSAEEVIGGDGKVVGED